MELYNYRLQHFQEIVEGKVKFPWPLFMLLDHPRFTLGRAKDRTKDLKRIIDDLDVKWSDGFLIAIEDVEDWK